MSRERELARLTALIDGELSDDEAAEVRRAIEQDDDLRATYEGLADTKRVLGATFADVIDSAPPPPTALREASTPDRTRLRVATVLTALAAAAAIIIAVVLNLPRGADPKDRSLSAAALLQLAASNYMDRSDAELYATLESDVVSALGSILGKKKDKPKKKAEVHFRIIVKSPHYFLSHPVANMRSTVVTDGPSYGHDGERSWNYDDEKNTITFDQSASTPFQLKLRGETTTTTFKSDAPVDDVLKYLSWDCMRSLAEGKGATLAEKTGPADRRVGRRRFVVTPKPTEGEPEWIATEVELTIDEEKALIERMRYDFQLAGVSIMKFNIELSRTDIGLTAGDFDYRSYVPEDAKIVEEPALEAIGLDFRGPGQTPPLPPKAKAKERRPK